MFLITGIGVAPGIAEGRALVVRTRRRDVRYLVAADRVRAEQSRLTEAQGRSRRQLEAIRAKLAGVAGQGAASLFEAQLLMIDDAMLVGRAAAFVRDERRNAEWALRAAADELVAVIGAAGDPYLRERHGDVRDVVERLVGNLRWESRGIVVPEGPEPWVLVADELAPSTVAQVDWSRAAGFVTEGGSWASHTAILARSLGVPAVVGVARATTAIPPGASVDLDGTTGECLINGDAPSRAEWHRRTAHAAPVARWERPAAGSVQGPARTLDGVDIRLDANLERPDELDDVLASGATHIGLFRSESLLTPDGRAPDEASQTAIYRRILAATPGEVTIRTFDAEPEPGGRHLGLRMLQVDPARHAQFEEQIRALLASADAGRLRILLPFVTDIHDLRFARTAIARAAETLRKAGVEVPTVPVGAMVEVPSAALTADRLAREADFLSVGTNDLAALTLAVGRDDAWAARFYDPLHPSMLRLLRFVARAGLRTHARVSVCGEMAAEPRALAVLIGLGLREFSIAPGAQSPARQLAAGISLRDARRLAREAFRPDEHTERRLADAIRDIMDIRAAR
jgi:phosphoenolpyruvate-protein phosphotransferase (PTS system enzyme I)